MCIFSCLINGPREERFFMKTITNAVCGRLGEVHAVDVPSRSENYEFVDFHGGRCCGGCGVDLKGRHVFA